MARARGPQARPAAWRWRGQVVRRRRSSRLHLGPAEGHAGGSCGADRPQCDRVQADSADLDDLDRLFDTVKREKGAIDVLWASAGMGEQSRLGEITGGAL